MCRCGCGSSPPAGCSRCRSGRSRSTGRGRCSTSFVTCSGRRRRASSTNAPRPPPTPARAGIVRRCRSRCCRRSTVGGPVGAAHARRACAERRVRRRPVGSRRRTPPPARAGSTWSIWTSRSAEARERGSWSAPWPRSRETRVQASGGVRTATGETRSGARRRRVVLASAALTDEDAVPRSSAGHGRGRR